MTTVTNSERLAWQSRALGLACELVDRSIAEHLPPLRWDIDTTGQLCGQVWADGSKRRDFTRWRDALGSPDREWEEFGRLTAVWESRDHVRVVLMADLGDEAPSGE